jgi:hypothetical protein
MTGANNYTSLFNNYFDCGRFIDRLNGKFGRGPNVNCVDCTHMVISLANALGCHLLPGRIQNPGGNVAFQLNPVTLIGYQEYTPPNKTFSFHQVALSPGTGDDAPDSVYDACIKFDMDIFEDVQKMKSAPDPLAPLTPQQEHRHPVNIPIGSDVFSYGYLALLAKPLEEPSQKDLSLDTGDQQNFSISALKFY